MGLSVPLVRPRANDPARWYAFATRDDYVRAGELPHVVGVRSAAEVEAAVSSVLRTPAGRLRQRGPETLSWRAYARSQRPNADELGWAWR
jgi:hypothetical protein